MHTIIVILISGLLKNSSYIYFKSLMMTEEIQTQFIIVIFSTFFHLFLQNPIYSLHLDTNEEIPHGLKLVLNLNYHIYLYQLKFTLSIHSKSQICFQMAIISIINFNSIHLLYYNCFIMSLFHSNLHFLNKFL